MSLVICMNRVSVLWNSFRSKALFGIRVSLMPIIGRLMKGCSDCWWKVGARIGGCGTSILFVQLSSIDRPSWTWFRDSQRRLMAEIPHTGMAVSSDRGDSLDVHPKQKREVGERLAAWALNKHTDIKCHSFGTAL